MFFQRKQKQRDNSKVQSVPLTENLSAQVWTAQNRDGSLRCHWQLRRRAENGGEPYVSMRVESLAEIPQALASLALAFSKAEGLPEDVRVDCGEFAVVMQRVVDLQNANGPLSDNKKPEGGLLHLA